jgi:hypothetical protein
MIILKKSKSIYKLKIISILATFTVASFAKLVSKVKLATTILISLIVLNAHVSFAETPFDGNYMGVKIGYVNTAAQAREITGWNNTDIGDYGDDGEMGSFFVGHNFMIDDLFYFGAELELGKLKIHSEKQLPGQPANDSIARTNDGTYLSPGLRFGMLKENTNYFVKAGKVYSSITQTFRDETMEGGGQLIPHAKRKELNGSILGIGFERFNNNHGLAYRVDYSITDFGKEQFDATDTLGQFFTFEDKLLLKILSFGISKKF